jgi:arginase family enzyme
VIHIDQHTDMRPVEDWVNVGNFLRYALDTGFIPGSTQINTEYSLLNFKTPTSPYILDIDLDFRDPAMSIECFDKTIQICKWLIENAQIITIATSPYFIDQNLAISLLHKLLT